MKTPIHLRQHKKTQRNRAFYSWKGGEGKANTYLKELSDKIKEVSREQAGTEMEKMYLNMKILYLVFQYIPDWKELLKKANHRKVLFKFHTDKFQNEDDKKNASTIFTNFNNIHDDLLGPSKDTFNFTQDWETNAQRLLKDTKIQGAVHSLKQNLENKMDLQGIISDYYENRAAKESASNTRKKEEEEREAEAKRRRAEELRKQEEERRKREEQEEEKRKAEEKRKREEQEEKKRKEEQKRQEEERRKQEEQKRKQEEQKRQEEERRQQLSAERKRLSEKIRKAEENNRMKQKSAEMRIREEAAERLRKDEIQKLNRQIQEAIQKAATYKKLKGSLKSKKAKKVQSKTVRQKFHKADLKTLGSNDSNKMDIVESDTPISVDHKMDISP